MYGCSEKVNNGKKHAPPQNCQNFITICNITDMSSTY